ncbi:MAG: peptidylprolyl isomerase, partial [Opitutales bacterium]
NKLQIVEFDEDKGQAENFEVVSTADGWFIPSHENYPADADNQLEDVASMLIGVTKLGVESEDKGSHKDYGVANPENAQPGSLGVGKLVRLAKDSDTLAELIIGKSFEAPAGVDSTRTLYYVREPGKDRVYSADIRNVDDVSTKFVDWVEKDFLDLDKWDVKQVHFDNYDFDESQRDINKAKRQIGKYTLAYADGNWTSPDLKMADGESLDTDVLDKLKDALDDLEIIDVKAKPDYLVGSLKKGNEFHDLKNERQLMGIAQSLSSKGFYVAQRALPGGQIGLEVVSNKGEIHVGMKDGVEYVLRFGEVYLGEEAEGNATGDSRYLYALARVNPSLLEAPQLEPIPPPLPPRAIPPSPDNNATKNNPPGNKGPEGEKGPADGKATELEAPPPPDANATAAYEQARAKRAGEIAGIKARNAAKQKEYNDKLKKAKKRVDELNTRLAPWYYVISNEVYDKIHLERKDFVARKIAASHVLVAFKGASRAKASITRTKQEAKARAEELRKQIVEEGKDFAEMASKNSDGPSASEGGDLGEFDFDGMAKPFSEAAFALEVGAVSAVVETEFGFHVIKRTK